MRTYHTYTSRNPAPLHTVHIPITYTAACISLSVFVFLPTYIYSLDYMSCSANAIGLLFPCRGSTFEGNFGLYLMVEDVLLEVGSRTLAHNLLFTFDPVSDKTRTIVL